MIRRIVCIVVLLLVAGCTGRHFVVERDVGEIDAKKSVSTQSETAWTVVQEPEAAAGEKPEAQTESP